MSLDISEVRFRRLRGNARLACRWRELLREWLSLVLSRSDFAGEGTRLQSFRPGEAPREEDDLRIPNAIFEFRRTHVAFSQFQKSLSRSDVAHANWVTRLCKIPCAYRVPILQCRSVHPLSSLAVCPRKSAWNRSPTRPRRTRRCPLARRFRRPLFPLSSILLRSFFVAGRGPRRGLWFRATHICCQGSVYREKGLFSDRVASKIFLQACRCPSCAAFRRL